MKEFHPEYIVDRNQDKKSVILPIKEWEEILLVMEEYDDIQAYDNAKNINEEIIPFNQAIEEIENSSSM